MRPPVGPNQVVGYVAPPAKQGGSTSTKQGVVVEVYDDNTARIDLTERDADGGAKNPGESLGHHTAIAIFDPERKQANSFHVLDENTAASAAPAPRRATQPAPAPAA